MGVVEVEEADGGFEAMLVAMEMLSRDFSSVGGSVVCSDAILKE